LFAQPLSSDDEDAAADFIVRPSQHVSLEDEEKEAAAHDEPHKAGGNVAAHTQAREVAGSPVKAATGGGGPSDAGSAQPKSGAKRGRWAASDE
jgi:hypothetical protein